MWSRHDFIYNWKSWRTNLTRTTSTPLFWGYIPHDYPPYHWFILDSPPPPPPPPWLPIPLIHIGFLVKTRQNESYKFKEFAKIWNFWILKTKSQNFTLETPSEVAWWDAKIWNGSGKYCGRYKADKILSTDELGETSILPFNFFEQGV